jgi:D-alanyl-D-alanine dipeptidase
MKLKQIFLFLFLSASSINFSQTGNGELVPIKDLIPNIVLDIKYASTDNFFEQKLYTINECYMLRELVDTTCGKE